MRARRLFSGLGGGKLGLDGLGRGHKLGKRGLQLGEPRCARAGLVRGKFLFDLRHLLLKQAETLCGLRLLALQPPARRARLD